MTCEKPKELKKYNKILNEIKCYEDWEDINYAIDEICLNIALCKNICGNNYCKKLQETI